MYKSDNTRILDRFQYHLVDLDCKFCLHKQPKKKKGRKPCHEVTCRFEDIRQEAIAHNRIRRPRKWDSDWRYLGK